MIRFGLTFQGKIEPDGALDDRDAAQVQDHAFPCAHTAELEDTARRAFKIAPLDSGRLLVVVLSSGHLDRFGRKTLRAEGCVADPRELRGSARDVAALWGALDAEHVEAAESRFMEAVTSRSAVGSETSHTAMLEHLRRAPDFAAAAAQALTGERVVLRCAADPVEVLASLQPILLLLPLGRLAVLDLCTEARALGDRHERVVGNTLPTAPLQERRRHIGEFLRGEPPVDGVWVDLVDHRVLPGGDPGPKWLVDALVDPAPWPGLTALERHQLLLSCLDAPQLSQQMMSPWDLSPDLARMRDAVARIESATQQIKKSGWATTAARAVSTTRRY